ncbi:sorting nexin-8-like [Diabrotica undecimpunctata]|uniref:sorting nexin-8-like n=1 Tax=Diabrotica undecimpunctata TaxID=50387 RepID=UPI003B640608
MSTDLSSASVPQLYRQVFDACSNDGQPVLPDIYQSLLLKCKLSSAQIEKICKIVGTSVGDVNRTNFYKTLALIAWCQQGKQVSEKLFENCTEKEYPSPEITDLVQIKNMKITLHKKTRSAEFNYSNITKRDSISVHLVPEKKGLFIKYSEYVVTSERFKTKVTRRYNDFVALKELLLNRFPYRLVPSLPPKKMVSDAHFLETRRRALQRWMTLVSRHPIISQDSIVIFFLTDQGPDCQHRIKDIFGRIPDEFMTSDVAANAKELLPPEHSQIAVNSQNIRTLVNVVGKMKQLTEANVERHNSAGRDFEEFINQLKSLSALNLDPGQANLENWSGMQKGFNVLSREMAALTNRSSHHAYLEQNDVCERLGLLLDILVAHKDLCERLEKGLHHDHAVALSKLLSMKKRKIQGVIRGTDAESVEHLESKMLTQENVITNMELRADFSLYCVNMETRLVYSYLETLSDIMRNLLNLQIKSHSELQDIWTRIQSLAQQFFRCDNQINGDILNNN